MISKRAKYTGAVPSDSNFCSINGCRSRLLRNFSVRLSFFRIPRKDVEKTREIHEEWKRNIGIEKVPSFFRIPRKEIEKTREIHEEWNSNIGIEKVPTWFRVCELHFEKDCFLRDLEAELTGRPIRRMLKEGAVPTIFLTEEENAIPELKNESVEEIKNNQTLIKLASELRKPIVLDSNVSKIVPASVQFNPKTIEPKPSLVFSHDSMTLNNSPPTSTALNILFSTEKNLPKPRSKGAEKSQSESILAINNARLELQVFKLRQEVTQLNKQLSIQSQLATSYKRKFVKRESVIKKLRTDLSALRKERRKLRQRDYMRKFKQKKVSERRKERRAWICKQIEAGKMDKTSLALIYSKKLLPFERNVSVLSSIEACANPPNNQSEDVIQLNQ